MIDKFPEVNRTFESRICFLRDIYQNLFSQQDIMAHCVAHKLDRSFLAYIDELKTSSLYLTGQDPLVVLKRLK